MFKTLWTTGLFPRCEPQELVRFIPLVLVSKIVGIAFLLDPNRSDRESGLNRLIIESLKPPEDEEEPSDCLSLDSRRFDTILSSNIRSELDFGTFPLVTSVMSEDPSGMPRRSRT